MRKLITCVYCAAFVAVVCAVDAYGVLEVSRNASPDEIKQSYKRLAKQWHPDRNKNPEASEKFMEISEAYRILSNELERRMYDYSSSFQQEQERSFYETALSSLDVSPSSMFLLIVMITLILAAQCSSQYGTSSSKQKTEYDSIGVPRLTHKKMDTMIINPDVMRRCVVVLVSRKESQLETIRAFRQAIEPYLRDNRVCFAWLATYDNPNWLEIIKTHSSGVAMPLGNGSIVAFNGRKMYFSVLAGDDLYPTDQASGSELEDTFRFGGTEGDNTPTETYCRKVATWLDQLLDGSLKKHYVEQWPDEMKANHDDLK
ncbi:dnaJ homolog subfamily C member 16-like [Corticium candelabrum]|uniref:dnaJ homolog subfamily C member 16-like n=1 Tax=Corticium candelabrum TaxID=121492 RepID=UPI002E25E9B1|nr:dnaJ homolog subfamily C member 16-like [Corticium candelabrum]